MSLDKKALDAWITREPFDECDYCESGVAEIHTHEKKEVGGIMGQFSDLDELLNSNQVDEYGCHKGCGEDYRKCRCEF